jgi:uncharacterized membrane protein
VWRPQFHSGKVVHFMTQNGGLERGVDLRATADPTSIRQRSMTFFTIDTLYRERWMREPRRRRVLDARWFPVVTTVQLVADMAIIQPDRRPGSATPLPPTLHRRVAGVDQPAGWPPHQCHD